MGSVSDDALWRRAGEGDQDAFADLFGRHARRVHSFCFRQTGDWALAEDLTSVTFLEAWRRRTVPVEDGKLLAWLLGIANNIVRHQRRSLRRYRGALGRLPAARAEPDHADESAARAAAEREAQELLERVREFPRKERDVIVLVGWEGLSTTEAAVALGIPAATVRSRLYRARRRLQARTEPKVLQPPNPRRSVSIDERTRL